MDDATVPPSKASVEDRLARLEKAASPRGSTIDRLLRYLPVIAFANVFLAAPAMLVSIAVAYFAFEQAEATKRMQFAEVWPNAVIETSNRAPDGRSVGTIAVVNNGVGPARIRGIELRYRDRTYTMLRDLLAACCTTDAARMPMGAATINGVVVPPGEKVVFARMDPERVPPDVWKRFERTLPDLQVKLCYCSVFDECWVADWDSIDSRSVAQCPTNWQQYQGLPQMAPSPRPSPSSIS